MNVFNDKDLSDRILRVEIVSSSDMNPKRNDSNTKRKAVTLEEKGYVGDVACDNSSKCSNDLVKVQTLHISSAMLAAKSPFFYKLFKNGMRESREKVVTLRINAHGSSSYDNNSYFVNNNTLNATSTSELMDVLIIADKFEVSSCMRRCSELLKDMHMSLDSALLILELPLSVSQCEAIEPLRDAARKYVAMSYKNVHLSQISRKEAATLPLSVIEIVLGSDGLQVKSERQVLDFILHWGRDRYPNKKERREILTELVGRFLHFPYLCMSTLEQIQECPDFNTERVSKLITRSLYFNSGHPYGQKYDFPTAATTTRAHGLRRHYDRLPIKAMHEGESCYVVHLNITKEECWAILDSFGRRHSQPFFLDGHWLTLRIEADEDIEHDYMGLFVTMPHKEDRYGPCKFDYVMSVMEDDSSEFKLRHEARDCTLTGDRCVGTSELFYMSRGDDTPGHVDYDDDYDSDDDSRFVVDGVVRVRVNFTINNS